MYHP
jgi:hypothetical protein